MLLEPVREALVQVGPGRLRQRVVRGVPDQEVPEAERIVLRQRRGRRPHELLSDEAHQLCGDRRVVGRERLHCAAVEDLPLDGAALERASLADRQLVEPRSEQRLDRRRDGDLAHRRESCTIASICSTKSGLPSAASAIRSRMPSASSAAPSRRSISSSVSLLGQRLEQHGGRVQLAAAPRRPKLEQLRSRAAQHEQRRIARPVGDVLDQIEERRLGPLQVVEVRRRADARERPTRRAAEPPRRCHRRRRPLRRAAPRSRRSAAARRGEAASRPRRRAST